MPEENNEVKKILQKKAEEKKILSYLRFALDENAFSRLMNIKVANEALYEKVVQYVLMFYQRMGRRLTEEELIKVIKSLKPSDKGGSITFIRK